MSERKTHKWFIRGALVFALVVLGASSLKLFDPLPLEVAATSSRLVLDRDGNLLRAFTTPDGRWRLDAGPEDISPTYLALLFAFEDRRFWRHPGIDPLAFGRAILQAIAHGKPISGGSTLTMQVARLLRGSPTHSISAKFQQVADAARLEWTLSKRQILSLYLKLAPYGGNLEGVRAASLAYFGKEPQRLSIAEAALLVTIPQSPEVRRPDRGYESLVDGRNRVIRRAAVAGAITHADAKAAIAQAVPRGRRDFPALAPHLSERLTVTLPNLSAIATSIDRNLQEAAETITRRNAQSFGEKISIAALMEATARARCSLMSAPRAISTMRGSARST